MEAVQPPLVRRPKARQFVLRRPGQDVQELVATRRPNKTVRLTYKGLHFSSTFLGLTVRKRNILRTDLWLVDPEAGPIAVALRQRWPRGIRYLLEWDGGSLLLIGGRTHYRWELFREDEVVGGLCMRPDSSSEALVSVPLDTPEEIVGFVVAVTEIARHHPALRIADRVLQARPIS